AWPQASFDWNEGENSRASRTRFNPTIAAATRSPYPPACRGTASRRRRAVAACRGAQAPLRSVRAADGPASWRPFSKGCGLLRAEARRGAEHHLGQPDDGVERRAQLVAHARKELRLVLARLLQLPALLLDFIEQPHVLNCDHRLVGESRNELNLFVGERPHLRARQSQNADGDTFAQHRHAQYGAKSAQCLGLGPCLILGYTHVGDVNDLTFQQG